MSLGSHSIKEMKTVGIILALLLVVGCESKPFVTVVVETTAGNIEVQVDTVAAPITASNFLRYVDAGFYTDGSFFRVVRMDNQPSDSIQIEVIQGGANPDQRESFFDPIVLERTGSTGLKHLDGTISMARGGPDSATHSFFICIGDQPSLDQGGMRNPDAQGFAAFGQVTKGMDIVAAIQLGVAEGQTLIDPVRILGIQRR